MPLWGRAVESQKKMPGLVDRMAVEIINKIDYDFTLFERKMNWVSQFSWVARSMHVDKTILEFIKKNPKATIVNMGCGLDTTFERIDNGQMMFYDLDLPEVIHLRKIFFQENERRKTISSSFLENKWLSQLQGNEDILFIAAGLFYFFDKNLVRDFFITIANYFPGSELFFDIASPLGIKLANKKVLKNSGMNETSLLKWGIKNPKLFEKWDERIQLVKEFPIFEGLKTGLPFKEKCGVWISDLLKIMSMVHLRIKEG